MAKESSLRHAVLEKLAPLHAVAIESHIESGVPDVNCTAGWIELKHLNEWPAHEATIVQPKHYKPEQRNWLRARCRVGSAWLLLRVGNGWCLLWGRHAAESLGVSLTSRDLQMSWYEGGQVRIYWPSPPPSTELIKALVVTRWLR